MPAPLEADALLRFLARQPHHRATLKQLLREFHAQGAARRRLGELLKQLTREERVAATRHAYELPPPGRKAAEQASGGKRAAAAPPPEGARAGEVAGRISLHRDGYAFLLPARGSAEKNDIFIPPPMVGGAMHGDTVAGVVLRRGADGRAEGRVVRILRRAHATVVGEFHAARGGRGGRPEGETGNWVRAFDDRIRDPILIPPGQERPPEPAGAGGAKEARGPHRVLGAEAPAAEWPATAEAMDGLVVDCEITRFATPTGGARGRLIEVLGRRDDFGIDVEIIIRKYHLPHRFAPETLAAAAAAPAVLPRAEVARRRDFRALPIVTIDGETARDFDDAVLVTELAGGGFELQVHIADVAHYVVEGGALDREARLRGTSVYFPDRAVPMLPLELSTDLCSLRPHLDRLTMSCVMEFDAEGEMRGYELAPGVIRSAARMTYTDVNAILEGDRALAEKYGEPANRFPPMLRLERILNERRRRRGSIDFDLPEPEIEFDEFGAMRSIVKSERNVAHRIIEEFMLAANETVARHLEGLGAPSVYRIHEPPDARKVAEFDEVAAAFGYSLGVPLPRAAARTAAAGATRGRGPGGRGRRGPAAAPATALLAGQKVAISPRHYQRLTERLRGRPEERILSYLMLRSLQQARYSPENAGHFALASPTYTHFTSPIRRYPDLLTHRILKAVLPEGGARGIPGGETGGRFSGIGLPAAPIALEDLRRMTEEASEAERRADEAERELIEWKKVRFMEARMGQSFPALILHVTKAGFFVELSDLFVEGFVPLANLEDDRYFFRPGARELTGQRTQFRYRVGDRLEVILARVDPIRHSLEFAPA